MAQNETQSVLKPRGRPRAFDRAVVLRAMREVFWEKGYAAASLDDLCHAAGLNRPSLYNAFGEKADVFKAVLDDYIAELRPVYEAAFTQPGTLAETLGRVFETSMHLWTSGGGRGLGCFMIGAALTDSVRDPEIGPMILKGLNELDRGYRWRVRRAVEAGELPADTDADALGRLASSVHNAVGVRLRAGEDAQQTREMVSRMIRVICGG